MSPVQDPAFNAPFREGEPIPDVFELEKPAQLLELLKGPRFPLVEMDSPNPHELPNMHLFPS
jgi:hypothetical protein